jgi:hypothetical protein
MGIGKKEKSPNGDSIRLNELTVHALCVVGNEIWLGADQKILVWIAAVEFLTDLRVCINMTMHVQTQKLKKKMHAAKALVMSKRRESRSHLVVPGRATCQSKSS